TQVGPNPLTQRLTVGVSARGEISRSDWDLTDYLPIIDDRIEIRFEGEFIRSDSQGTPDQRSNLDRPRPSTNSSSLFNGIPGRPAEFGESPAAGNSDVSINPSQTNGSILSE
ncbi:MAG: YceI family protein, partial [Gammaproteobacteria bacterium]